MTLDPATRMGAVRLRVADIDQMTRFYERVIGLEVLDRKEGIVALGCEGEVLLELAPLPRPRPRPRGTTGLFHLAILLPHRAGLGGAIRRVLDTGWTFTGAADHLVSEALYLDDPEGNGIELYRDRPRDEWRYEAGELAMATLSLDVSSILDHPGARDEGPEMPPGTSMGHVHLQVAELEATERFYSALLGFSVTVRSYPEALFVSAGGYHHHLGLNTWASRGGSPAPPDAVGLDRYTVIVPDDKEIRRVRTALQKSEAPLEENEKGLLTSDPSGNRVMIRAG